MILFTVVKLCINATSNPPVGSTWAILKADWYPIWNVVVSACRILSGFDGEKISILYGGSVNRNNAKSLIALDDVDGFLIGGASTNEKIFIDIMKKSIN